MAWIIIEDFKGFKANSRINEIKDGSNPPLSPDSNAKYHAELTVDLDTINEPMIADPDVENEDISKRYTHDTLRPLFITKDKRKLI